MALAAYRAVAGISVSVAPYRIGSVIGMDPQCNDHYAVRSVTSTTVGVASTVISSSTPSVSGVALPYHRLGW
jgi:hypothetical protein